MKDTTPPAIIDLANGKDGPSTTYFTQNAAMIIQLILLIILICLSGFFSGTETAFTSLSMVQVGMLKQDYPNRGRLIDYMFRKPDILLTTILIGNNLVNIGASALATKLTIDFFGNAAIGATTGILTLFILIFGEVTPKRIAILKNEFICLHTVRLIFFLSYLFRPFIYIISLTSNFITRIFGIKQKQNLSLEGILHMVNLAESMGIVENYETQMVKNIFRFDDITLQSIMTHRTMVFSLDEDETIQSVISKIHKNGYSRIPVYKDDPEQITGVVLTKEVMRLVSEGQAQKRLKSIKMEPIFVPQSKKVNEMFVQFKREDLNMAVVMDEYGGLAGIVTLEDVIEEILGEIYDEFEVRERDKIQKAEDGSYILRGDTPIDLLSEIFPKPVSHDKTVQTLGGYIVEQIGRIPQRNEVIEHEHGRFIVLSMKSHRILTVRFIPFKTEESPL
ncbi:MAG: hemolysin family protein [Spirochaetia bacterium]